MEDRSRWAPEKRFINPLFIALPLAPILLLCAYFRINETFVSAALLAVFVAITILNATNGLSFILLAMPFFLCESGRPFSWMTDAFVYTIIAVWGMGRIMDGGFRPPLAWPALFVALTAVICFPVDLKEYLLSFTTWPPSHQFYLMRIGWGYQNSLRFTLNVVSGVILFFAAWDIVTRAGREYLHALLRSVVALAGVYCVIGIAMLHCCPVEGRSAASYLGMSLVGVWNASTTTGVWNPSLTALAYNPQFTVQWLGPIIPLTVYFAFADRDRKPWLAVHLVSFALIVYALFASGQRSATLMTGFFLVVIPLVLYVIRARQSGRPPIPTYAVVSAFAVGAAVAFSLAWRWIGIPVDQLIGAVTGYIDDPMYLSRYGITDARFFLWHTAVRMAFFNPLTGVGLGKFYPLFFDYFDSAQQSFGTVGFAAGSAHSMYFHTLAEQGLAGVAVWSLFIIGVYTIAFRGFSTPGRWFAMSFSTSLAIWLVLGISHDMFFVRSIGIQFWILSALAVYSGDSKTPVHFLNRRFVVGVLIALFAVFALRVGQSIMRPISKNFAEGFHQWEAQPDGSSARWMGGRALMGVEVAGKTLALDISAPVPDLDKRPQVARIVFDGQEKELVFSDTEWQTVVFNVDARLGETRLLKINVDHVFNPARLGGEDDRDLGVMVKKPRWVEDAR